ncbi:Sulfotransferase 1C2 (ST1C2) (Sulfotransferase 1C1) (SULT1C|uniref:Sulfotransferase 1C2 (ST1C2) (Sulfotransferase 1C1) (SULT1C\
MDRVWVIQRMERYAETDRRFPRRIEVDRLARHVNELGAETATRQTGCAVEAGNGYNTMASYFRFRLGLGHLRDRRNFGTFVNDRRMYPGTSWADHVRSWQHAEQRGVKIFWLRYEALEEHTEAELQRLAQFLGLKAEEEHLSLAVNASSASTMQEMEHTEGGLNFFKLRYNRSSLKFVSSGQGNMATKRLWQDVSEEVLRTWRQHNGPTMRCLGYPDAPV